MLNCGKIHLYIGDGKGKTTAAVGQIVRICGCGGKAVFAQFLKDNLSGERTALAQMPGVTLLAAPESVKFVFQMSDEEKAACAAHQQRMLAEAFERAKDAELLVLDEALDALALSLITEELRMLLDNRPQALEVVLTGRAAPAWLCERAAYITRMEKVKHPYDQGLLARRGIEY